MLIKLPQWTCAGADREPISLPVQAFECPICLLVLRNPVSCNLCGSMLCKDHVAEIRECPICQERPFRVQSERGVCRLMNDVQFQCKYCKRAIPKMDLEVHETNCPKRPRRCGAAGCKFETLIQADGLRHLIQSHGQLIWESYTEATLAGIKT